MLLLRLFVLRSSRLAYAETYDRRFVSLEFVLCLYMVEDEPRQLPSSVQVLEPYTLLVLSMG